ncbi:hypothetical protein [Streptomyces sp. NPDC002851]
MRAIRRTIRTAAVVTGAVAALGLPAQAAFAEAAGEATGEPSGTASASPSAGERSGLREFVGTTRLADGSVAKVYGVGEGRFEAEISSWAYDVQGKLIEKFTVRKDGSRTSPASAKGKKVAVANPTTPTGGVRAGAEGAGATTPEPQVGSAPMVAAGGGIAALGAAGLGFALLRRRVTD